MTFELRVVCDGDAPAIREIYTPYCESTPVTFDEHPPTVADIERKIDHTLERYPWLVADDGEEVVGYAYASPLRKHDAYEWVVELSVYVRSHAQNAGIGRTLYAGVCSILAHQGVRDVYAVTAVPNPEAEAFHERLGFELLGSFPEIGYAQGAWRDVKWWRKPIAEKTPDPEPVTPFSTLLEEDHEHVVAALQEALDDR